MHARDTEKQIAAWLAGTLLCFNGRQSQLDFDQNWIFSSGLSVDVIFSFFCRQTKHTSSAENTAWEKSSASRYISRTICYDSSLDWITWEVLQPMGCKFEWFCCALTIVVYVHSTSLGRSSESGPGTQTWQVPRLLLFCAILTKVGKLRVLVCKLEVSPFSAFPSGFAKRSSLSLSLSLLVFSD